MYEAKVVCAVCDRNVPDGDCMSRLRLTAQDMIGQQFPIDRKPGLRGHCCQSCRNVYLPVIAARLGKKVEEMGAHDTF